MKRTFARLLVVIGLGLVAWGRKLDKPAPPVAKVVALPRRHYRVVNNEPSRGEVYRLGLGILFNSLAYGLGGA